MPNWNHIVREHLAALRLPPEREIEIVEEQALHLEAAYEDALADGLPEAEAGARALRSYDWRLLECELSRAERPLAARALQPPLDLIERKGGIRMGSFIQDLRFGIRTLLERPGFTLIVIITIALGIGMNTAIFSVVNAVLLRPLPGRDSDRFVTVYHDYPKINATRRVSAASFIDYSGQGDVFESAAALQGVSLNLTGQGEPERIDGRRVSASYFQTIGIDAEVGRTFLPEEEQPGKHHVALISHSLWQQRFGADPNIAGRAVELNGETYTVIGVIPPIVQQYNTVWIPLALTPEQKADRTRENLWMIARLKPGVSRERAQASMNVLARRVMQEHPENYPAGGEWGVRVDSRFEEVVQGFRPALHVLLGAVGFVLLIASANVSNLLLARSAARGKEMAIRAALGAGRLRVIRQLLTESLLLALVGGGLGTLAAWWGTDLLINLNRDNLPRAQEYSMDSRVLAFALGLSVLTSLLFGLAPALQASKTDLIKTLKEGGLGAAGSRRAYFRSLLVVAEIALTLILLIGGGLMLKSFVRLLQVDPGFRPDNLLTMQLSLPDYRYREARQARGFYSQVLERVKALPGVQSAGLVSQLPLSGSNASGAFAIEGRTTLSRGQASQAEIRAASPEYIQTLGVPLRAGRYFSERDKAESAKVMIIDETLARLYWPHEEPLGKRVGLSPSGEQIWYEIIGVVGSVKQRGLDEEYRGTLYIPYDQAPPFRNLFLAARTGAEPTSITSAVREAIQTLDRNQPVSQVKTMERRIIESVAQRRFSVVLLGLFAAVALVMAASGLYGIISYLVSQRTHEIGVRMALGARARDVLKMVIRQGFGLALAGIAVGLSGALILTRWMKVMLYGVSATDPQTFALIALLLVAIALLACFVPARRATKVDPMVALRRD
jgi:putative ABC transport system permease protein